MNTQIGLIAEMLQSFEDEGTPLQNKLAHLGKVLGTACLPSAPSVFVYGLFRDTHLSDAFQNGFLAYLESERKDIVNLFMTAVSLAIAAVPEGLPAIVTICLALGMQRMIKHHALIRKLPAVETLGCATVVCSDKTGTLTQNQMTVVQGWAGGKRLRVTGEGYAPIGEFFVGDERLRSAHAIRHATRCWKARPLCNDAKLEETQRRRHKRHQMAGASSATRPKARMIVAAAKAGYSSSETCDGAAPRVQEIPFDSERKRMTTIHRSDGLRAMPQAGDTAADRFVKGAPDVVLDLCTHTARRRRQSPS